MCYAQTEWLLSHFAIADQLCAYIDPVTMEKWDIPRLAGGHLYTVCK